MQKLQRRIAAGLPLASLFFLLPALAWAQQGEQDLAGPQSQNIAATLANFAPYGLMFFVVYFLMLRPANKQRREQQEMLARMKKDDEIITTSGIIGRIVSLDEDLMVLEVADKVRLRMPRDRIAGPFVAKAVAAARVAAVPARGGK